MTNLKNQNENEIGGIMRRFLWFIPKCPLPAQDGARVATTVLLKGLTALGEKIDLLIFAAEDEVVDFSSLREELGIFL